MWFRKSKLRAESFRFPGKTHALDGHGVVYTVETMACDAVLVRAAPEFAEVTGPTRRLTPAGFESIADQPATIRHVEQVEALLARLAGYAQSGLRCAGITSSLSSANDALSSSSGKHLAYVLNLTCRAFQRHANALHGGHDDYYRAGDSGCFQLFAKNAQEVADLTLIAHRVAELSLTPGICAQDYYRTTQSVQTVRMPERGLAAIYLGRPEDPIPSPTAAQRFVFGSERRRIPILVDGDRPAGIGGTQDAESYFKALAAQRPFFADHVGGLIDQAMSEFAKLTGRVYRKVSGYRMDDAEVVVVAQGAVLEELEAAADYLREREKIKAGVLSLTAFRPFPGRELTQWLKGKSAVTVLERTDQPLAEDLPIIRETRAAVAKSIENGAAGEGAPPHPGYESFARPSDHPRMYAGVYGVGGLVPAFGDLCAVFRNMAPKGAGRRFFYVGSTFETPDRRYPHLESLHQSVEYDYPGLSNLALPREGDVHPGENSSAVQLHSLSLQGGIFAGNIFAQTLAKALRWTVRTFPDGGLEPSIQPVTFTLVHGSADEPIRSKPDLMDVILVSGDRLTENLPSKTAVRRGGILVIETNRDPVELGRSLSARALRWIVENDLRVHTVDARKIAMETASRPSFVDQLAVWALWGAFVAVSGLAPAEREDLTRRLRDSLGQVFGASAYISEDITRCFERGAREIAALDAKRLAGETGPSAVESAPPWTVEKVERHDRTVFDVNRFWHSVGYLYDAGESEKALADPYLATGIIPAGSSAFRDMTPYRLRIPVWRPDECEACGLCWSICPDSALPSTAQSVSAILETAARRCETEGHALIQLQRLMEPLSKQIYNGIVKGGARGASSFGSLARDAFTRLMERMEIAGDTRAALEGELERMCGVLEGYPVSVTERLFLEPHGRAKGSGSLLSIAHNPMSCTGCGLCVEVCPKDAYVWREQTPAILERERKAWDFHMQLPETPSGVIDGFISEDEPETEVYRLLDKTAYHSMVGGDAASPGNGVKTAVHLVMAAAESVMRPRFAARVARLDELIEQLEKKIQGKVSGALEINDFERFGERLNRLRREGLSAEALLKMIESEGGPRDLDPDQLARLTGLLDQIREQRRLYVLGGSGAGRARMALTIDPGTATFWSGMYPYNPVQHPWVSHLPGDAPSLAEGVFEGIARRAAEEVKVVRIAELEVGEAYDSAEHDAFFENFGAADMSEAEWGLVPPVIVITHTVTTHTEEIATLLSSRHPIRIVLIDTRGISIREDLDRHSEAQPCLDAEAVDDLEYLLMTRRDVFVHQTTIGHPGHLIRGVAEGLRQRRPAVFHVYAPDPQLNGIAAEKIAEHARRAFESRAFPLFTLDPSRPDALLSLDANPDRDRAWTAREITVKEPSGSETTLSRPLTVADWAFGEARFQRFFKIVPKGHQTEISKPLDEYLELAPEDRAGYEPYIDIVDENHHHFLALVSPAMARGVESRLGFWMYLIGLAAGPARGRAVESGAPAARRTSEPPPLDHAIRERLTETLLELCGFSTEPDFFKQSLAQFIDGAGKPRGAGLAGRNGAAGDTPGKKKQESIPE